MYCSVVVAMLGLVSARKQAVYSSNYTKAYLLTNDELYTLVLSGQTEDSETLARELKQIQPPPDTDSKLVLDSKDTLYSIYGAGCGTAIDIQEYNASSNSWSQLASSEEGWYNLNSTSWYDSGSNSIMVYGGVDCNNSCTQNFYKYDISGKQWSLATANPMPREMAYSTSLAISEDSTLLLGGRTNDGWLSMQQVAIWQYGGWSYWPVSNFTGVDSRDDPYLLPMWNNSESSVSGVLVVGGTVAGRDASPNILTLKFNQDSGWYWDEAAVPDASILLTVYNTVYSNNTIYAPSGTKQQSVTPAQLNSISTPITEKKRLNIGSIAALSTIIPLLLIIVTCVAVWIWWRKRKQRTVFQPRQSQLVDNQSLDIDNFSEFHYPPVRQRQSKFQDHQKDNSHSDYQQDDIRFLVNRNSNQLRVVNPDMAEESSISSLDTLASETGVLVKDTNSLRSVSTGNSDETISNFGSVYRHRATGSIDGSDLRRTVVSTSRSSSGSIKKGSRDLSASSFDFRN